MRLPWLLNHSDLGRKKRSGLIFRTKFLRMLKLERDGNIKASPVITRQTRELSFKLCSNAFFPVDLLALRPSLNQSETSLPPTPCPSPLGECAPWVIILALCVLLWGRSLEDSAQ